MIEREHRMFGAAREWINSDDPNIEVGSYVDTQVDAGNGQYPLVQGMVVEVRPDVSFLWITSALVELAAIQESSIWLITAG